MAWLSSTDGSVNRAIDKDQSSTPPLVQNTSSRVRPVSKHGTVIKKMDSVRTQIRNRSVQKSQSLAVGAGRVWARQEVHQSLLFLTRLYIQRAYSDIARHTCKLQRPFGGRQRSRGKWFELERTDPGASDTCLIANADLAVSLDHVH